jgi:hypothetical protein
MNDIQVVDCSAIELGKAFLALSCISWCTRDWFKRETMDCNKGIVGIIQCAQVNIQNFTFSLSVIAFV